MFSYYFELLNKPEYLLSHSEKLFIDVFPLLCISAIGIALIIVGAIYDVFKGDKK